MIDRHLWHLKNIIEIFRLDGSLFDRAHSILREDQGVVGRAQIGMFQQNCFYWFREQRVLPRLFLEISLRKMKYRDFVRMFNFHSKHLFNMSIISVAAVTQLGPRSARSARPCAFYGPGHQRTRVFLGRMQGKTKEPGDILWKTRYVPGCRFMSEVLQYQSYQRSAGNPIFVFLAKFYSHFWNLIVDRKMGHFEPKFACTCCFT